MLPEVREGVRRADGFGRWGIALKLLGDLTSLPRLSITNMLVRGHSIRHDFLPVRSDENRLQYNIGTIDRIFSAT